MPIATANTARPPKALLFLAFGAIYILWGSSFLAIRYTVETLPPFLMAGVRAFVAGVLLFSIVGFPQLRTLKRVHWRTAAISGGLFFLGCHGLLFRVEKTMDSGVAALVLATIPSWIVILSWLTGHTTLTARTLVGLLLGFVAVASLVLFQDQDTPSACPPASACALLVAAMLWACGSLYGRSAPMPKHSGTATAMQLLCGGAIAILAGLAIGEGNQIDPANVSTRSMLAMLYLIIVGSVISFSAYTWLLRVAKPATVGTYAYINPLVAVLLGCLVGGESLSPYAIFAGAVIIASVVLIHHDQNRTGRQAAT